MDGDTERPQPPHVKRWQTVLNEHWPVRPAEIRDQPPIPVRVRIVWEHDGEQYLTGEATRWNHDHVYVRIPNTGGRLAGQGTWLKPRDVYRPASTAS